MSVTVTVRVTFPQSNLKKAAEPKAANQKQQKEAEKFSDQCLLDAYQCAQITGPTGKEPGGARGSAEPQARLRLAEKIKQSSPGSGGPCCVRATETWNLKEIPQSKKQQLEIKSSKT